MTSMSGRIPNPPAGPAALDATVPLPVRVMAVAAAAALTALSARFTVPLPGVAVPFTLQPVAVLLSVSSSGRVEGSPPRSPISRPARQDCRCSPRAAGPRTCWA